MRRALWGLALFFFLAPCACKSNSTSAVAATTAARARPATVVMAINLGEEDEEGGCGDVIHAVRAAAQKGVRTREIDTRNKADLEVASKTYRIMVQPTVILLDAADKEVRRYEGESRDTITALKADLNQMAQQ